MTWLEIVIRAAVLALKMNKTVKVQAQSAMNKDSDIQAETINCSHFVYITAES